MNNGGQPEESFKKKLISMMSREWLSHMVFGLIATWLFWSSMPKTTQNFILLLVFYTGDFSSYMINRNVQRKTENNKDKDGR